MEGTKEVLKRWNEALNENYKQSADTLTYNAKLHIEDLHKQQNQIKSRTSPIWSAGSARRPARGADVIHRFACRRKARPVRSMQRKRRLL